jgi:hypothetical protein
MTHPFIAEPGEPGLDLGPNVTTFLENILPALCYAFPTEEDIPIAGVIEHPDHGRGLVLMDLWLHPIERYAPAMEPNSDDLSVIAVFEEGIKRISSDSSMLLFDDELGPSQAACLVLASLLTGSPINFAPCPHCTPTP